MDANGSTTPAAMTFYKRAKALYDANYEDDRVTIVQALILLAWWWEGPEGMCFHPVHCSTSFWFAMVVKAYTAIHQGSKLLFLLHL
jgi:hypothetical protein